MMNTKSKLEKYIALFAPSSLGWVMYITLAALTIVLNQFEMIKKYLDLPKNFQLTRIVAEGSDKILTSTIGESRTETLVVGLFWAVVGLVVYLFLKSLAAMVVELDDDVSVRGYVWPKGTNRYRPLEMFLGKSTFRLVAFVALLFAASGPLAAILRGPVLTGFTGDNKIVLYLVWFVAGVIMWHIVTILMRLVALRARLFG